MESYDIHWKMIQCLEGKSDQKIGWYQVKIVYTRVCLPYVVSLRVASGYLSQAFVVNCCLDEVVTVSDNTELDADTTVVRRPSVEPVL